MASSCLRSCSPIVNGGNTVDVECTFLFSQVSKDFQLSHPVHSFAFASATQFTFTYQSALSSILLCLIRLSLIRAVHLTFLKQVSEDSHRVEDTFKVDHFIIRDQNMDSRSGKVHFPLTSYPFHLMNDC